MNESIFARILRWIFPDESSTTPIHFPPSNWETIKAFNMRIIERNFLDGEDVRLTCDWMIACGRRCGDEGYVCYAQMLKAGCQAEIDNGKLIPGSRAVVKALTPDEIRAVREAYR